MIAMSTMRTNFNYLSSNKERRKLRNVHGGYDTNKISLKKSRLCLECGKKFLSIDPYNHLCGKCVLQAWKTFWVSSESLGEEDNMQNKEKYSDRRHNKRRHDRSSDPAFDISLPDQDKRHGDRRCDRRRGKERLNVSFEVLLPDQNSMTTNVSASGVCFEVAKKDMKAFPQGKIISLQMIDTVTNTPGSRERRL